MSEFRTVLRPIAGPVGDIASGTIVDVSGWRTVNQLVRMGRLGDIVEEPTQVKRGRPKATVVESSKEIDQF